MQRNTYFEYRRKSFISQQFGRTILYAAIILWTISFRPSYYRNTPLQMYEILSSFSGMES